MRLVGAASEFRFLVKLPPLKNLARSANIIDGVGCSGHDTSCGVAGRWSVNFQSNSKARIASNPEGGRGSYFLFDRKARLMVKWKIRTSWPWLGKER